MKKIIMLLLVAIMVLSFASCGNGEAGGGAATGPAYTVAVTEIDANAYPDDYPLIASDDFEAAFVNLKAANLDYKLTDYKSIVDIFGIDGAYYENCDMDYSGELYKYYGWYADNGVSVIITFKADGNKLEYYAWSGNGIS